MDPLVAHQRAQDLFAGILANVSPDELGAPTPCSEWTIGDLIEHVIGGNEHVGKWAANPIEPPVRPDDIVAAHQTAAAAAQGIFADPDGMLEHPRFHAHLILCDRCAFRREVERSTRPRLPRADGAQAGA
jgi:uncharacterized protein (TIGR03086 family)